MRRAEMTCAKCIYFHDSYSEDLRTKEKITDFVCREDTPANWRETKPWNWCGDGMFEDDNGQLWAFHEGTTEKSESFYASSRVLKIRLPNVGEDD